MRRKPLDFVQRGDIRPDLWIALAEILVFGPVRNDACARKMDEITRCWALKQTG